MVKISNKVLLAGGLATAVALTGCKKYEDGPGFSLLTKTQRLTGDWEVTKWIPDGEGNYIDGYDGVDFDIEIEFDKDGDFDMRNITTYTGYSGMYTANVSGEWEFSSDKEEIELDFEDSTPNWEIEITRLTNEEFEGEVSSAGSTSKVRFEAVKK